MRYDPDVPMSKEEAAAWRKEQRRKRNRESAAASRQRQRDRISELEQEVSEWKMKYEEALARMERLEQRKRMTHMEPTDTLESKSSTAVSPCSSPLLSSVDACAHTLLPEASSCGLVSLQDQSHCMDSEGSLSCEEEHDAGERQNVVVVRHLSEKISRPA